MANVLITSAVLLSILGSGSQAQLNSSETTPKASLQELAASPSDQESCLQAARKFLGLAATLLKCGHLSGPNDLEAVAATLVPNVRDDAKGIPVSRLVIARHGASRWKIELNVDVNNEITNDAGYVGVDFIEDSPQFPYYRVNFTDRGAKWGIRTPAQFTLVLFSMNHDGRVDTEDIGLGIGWNPVVKRFQEIEPNGEEFAPEVKAPKRIRATVKP